MFKTKSAKSKSVKGVKSEKDESAKPDHSGSSSEYGDGDDSDMDSWWASSGDHTSERL